MSIRAHVYWVHCAHESMNHIQGRDILFSAIGFLCKYIHVRVCSIKKCDNWISAASMKSKTAQIKSG